jgi:hypothetical protein
MVPYAAHLWDYMGAHIEYIEYTEYNEYTESEGGRTSFAGVGAHCGDQTTRSTRSWDPKWRARQFGPSMLGIIPLDPQGHGIKSGLRVNLIP